MMERLKCPGCGAPADMTLVQVDPTRLLQCRYCGTTYRVSESRESSAKALEELKEWVKQVLPEHGTLDPSATGTVDVGMRHLFFSHELYPALKRDAERCLTQCEAIFELPLFHTCTTVLFPSYLPDARLVSEELRTQLKALETRTTSHQLHDFALFKEDKALLHDLQSRIQPLLYYVNIVQRLTTPDVASYKIIRENMLALQKEYIGYQSKSKDPAYRTYLESIDHRLSGAVLFLDALISTAEASEKGVAKQAVERARSAQAQLREAEEFAQQSTYDDFLRLRLVDGIKKDLFVGSVVILLFQIYEKVTRMHFVDFASCCEQVKTYIQALAPHHMPEKQLVLLERVNHLLSVHAGDSAERFVNEWAWLKPALEKARKAKLLSRQTKVEITRFFQPCWIAKLQGRRKTGFLTTSEGVTYLLVDAATLQGTFACHRDEHNPLMVALETNPAAFADVETDSTVLPALLTEEEARRAFADYAAAHRTELGSTDCELVGLVYIPVAWVTFAGKSRNWEEHLSPLPELQSNIEQILVDTETFLGYYPL